MKKPREKSAEVLSDNKEYIGLTIGNVRELASQGKPQNLKELRERIDGFFDFCEVRNLRPGIEMLSSALGIRRETLWRWCAGSGCSPEWSLECLRAKQIISSTIESLGLSGHLSPPIAIFWMKNVAGFVDAPEKPQREEIKPSALSAAELPMFNTKNV